MRVYKKPNTCQFCLTPNSTRVGRKHCSNKCSYASRTGVKRPLWVVAKIAKANLGKKRSKEACLNMRMAHLGKPTLPTQGFQKGHTVSKGRKFPERSGANHKWWKGGITPVNQKIRSSSEYADWRTQVFKRDDYTCQECGSRGYKLNADHIKPFAYYPELRLAIDNGRTLCVPCHKKTETFGIKGVRNYEKVKQLSK